MTNPTYQITVQPSGRQFVVHDDATILAAAINAGVGLPYGCKDGACGSCKCRKLSGTVLHDSYSDKALTGEEVAAGWVLTCRARVRSDVVLESRQVTDVGSFAVRKLPVRVMALERISNDVMSVRLQLPASEKFLYHAGQFIEFILRDGSRRAYSMATAPHVQETTPGLTLHIRHMPGGLFTDHVFGAMKEKEILRIEGPFGSFFLREDSDRPMIFLASGTGFAPIKALIEHIHHRNIVRPVRVYWGGRRPADLYMHDWLQAQTSVMQNLTYIPVVSDAQPDDNWAGRTGYVHQAVLDDFVDLGDHAVYACGAPAMVRAAQNSYIGQRNLPPEYFFADAFTSAADQ